jgi:hypothetical protein
MAQELPIATLYGKVLDEQGHPIEMANVVVPELLIGYTTNSRGYYELSLFRIQLGLFMFLSSVTNRSRQR